MLLLYQPVEEFAAGTDAALLINPRQRLRLDHRTDLHTLDCPARSAPGLGARPARRSRQAQTRLLVLEFAVPTTTRWTQHGQQFISREGRQIAQRTTAQRPGEFAVEPDIPPLTPTRARSYQRMIAAYDQQPRRCLDFPDGLPNAHLTLRLSITGL